MRKSIAAPYAVNVSTIRRMADRLAPEWVQMGVHLVVRPASHVSNISIIRLFRLYSFS
ncbi:MAG: hypothetical protein ACK4K3_08110 [Aquabacterium sp.]|jgi:hypothetical protein